MAGTVMVVVNMLPVSGVPLSSCFWKVLTRCKYETQLSLHVRLQVLVQTASEATVIRDGPQLGITHVHAVEQSSTNLL